MPLACVYDRKESEQRGESISSCHTCAIELTGQYMLKYQATHQDAHQTKYQDEHWESIRFHHVRQRAIVR
jgi:pyruvoyl-dependent arginine decarboxylase (PvlArgDC)